MGGLTTGPRQFPMMKGSALVNNQAFKEDNDWIHWETGTPSAVISNETKLDLRAFDGKALDFANIVIQESGPVSFPVLEGESRVSMVIYDVFSTVPIIQDSEEAANIVFNLNTPGFISNTQSASFDVPGRALNPSQVVYGMWRVFAHSRDAGDIVPTVYTSSEFGTGELVVAPELYWTRYVSIYKWDTEHFYYVPSANAMLTGLVIDVSEGQELAQMARAAQR